MVYAAIPEQKKNLFFKTKQNKNQEQIHEKETLVTF
jgi:hypothetical protein